MSMPVEVDDMTAELAMFAPDPRLRGCTLDAWMATCKKCAADEGMPWTTTRAEMVKMLARSGYLVTRVDGVEIVNGLHIAEEWRA